ncbi:alanine--tRNA ligase [Gemmata sp.]|uniref:alanine--tRNA ligase n=1 Tax=Gemmata sp. TaxID=1914242 RepID=UPI003F6FEF92
MPSSTEIQCVGPTSTEIRQQFVDFFCKKYGHANVASSPVVPHDDPTLLFANAGMNQFKPYFLGTEKPPVKRVANTQKCIRAGGKHNDLDDVGKDTYHHTFFEMLGNWSFGDYFKKDAIAWAWELLTEVWKLDKTRLHVTVFEGDPANGIPRDDEAAGFWKAVGVPEAQIHLGNKKDNFWEMGNTGPCGPCTEVHIDRTPDKTGGPLVNGGTDKVIEIWNLVFIQFNRNEDQSLTPLPAQHVDTGMGFERICSVLQGKSSNYDTDVFTPIFEAVQKVTGAPAYTGVLEDLKDTAYRVIGDHIRTLTFALTDGAVIGNLGRDYVLKRILRRAERYGVQVLGTTEPFLYRLVSTVVENFSSAFPELKNNAQRVSDLIYDEEAAFLRTLKRGIKLFEKITTEMAKTGRTVVSGDEAFKLHDTYGVIIDITQQMAQEQGLTVDVAGFEKAMEVAQKKSAEGGKKFAVTAVKGDLPRTDDSPKFQFVPVSAKVLGWVKDHEVATSGTVAAGDEVALLLDRTNFYGEQGGQVGDTGTVRTAAGADFEVTDTQRLGETVLHVGILHDGELAVGDTVELIQGTIRRLDVMRNHTATHLLNLALRQILGSHVEQKGSLVDEAKTRFDFSHDKPIAPEQLREIERRVNRQVVMDQPVTAVEMPLAQAKELPGVRAVFGEKYPDPVRVVMIGAESPDKLTHDESVEFCGGTHMPRTGLIGYFKILSQEGVAKGIRRITAVTGKPAYDDVQNRSAVCDELAGTFQCHVEELPRRVAVLQDEVKKLQAQLKRAEAAQLTTVIDTVIADAPTVGGAKLIVSQLPAGTSVDAVRTQIDRIRQKNPSAFVVFGWTEDEGKVPLIAALTNDLVKKGMKSGDIVKQVATIIGGSGGGKPDMAQAGGKDASKLPDALKKAADLGRELLAK